MLLHHGDAREDARIPRAVTLRRRNAGLARLFGKTRMNKLVGNRHRNRRPQPLPDPLQHHVDHRRSSGAGHAVTVNFEERLPDLHPRKTFTKARQAFPMAGRLIAIQHARTRQNERPRIHPGKQNLCRRQFAQGNKRRLADPLLGLIAGAHHQHGGTAHIGQAARNGNRYVIGSRNRLPIRRNKTPGKYLPGEAVRHAQGFQRPVKRYHRKARNQVKDHVNRGHGGKCEINGEKSQTCKQDKANLARKRRTPMNPKIIITCAVTGAGDTVGKSPNVPVTPEQIANSALEAAAAGAAVVHCHVRDPKTGKGSRGVHLYREVMERIRAKNKDVIINLTAGMGGDLDVGPGETPMKWGAGTDLVGPVERLLHIAELRPELCTLDCGSLNFGDGNTMVVQTPAQLREQARLIKSYGVKPEMEIFDSGNLWFAKQLCIEGLIDSPPLFQLCLGIPWGAPYDTETMAYQKAQLPKDAIWAAFGIGRNEFPAVAQAVLLGGHVRVGLEDNLWLEKGVHATNGKLVEKAVKVIEILGTKVATPDEARAILQLKPRKT